MEPEEKKENLSPEGESPVTGSEAIQDDTNIDVADRITLEKDRKSRNAWLHFVYFLRRLFSIRDDTASHAEIRERILGGGHFTGTNMVIMCCAILICCVGLNLDNIAVIIGAMLISPLMNRILMMAYATASDDRASLKRGVGGFLLQVLISITFSCLYFLISPIKEPTAQIEARTTPTIYDVIVAIFGGIAGIIGQTRRGEYNNVIPGVAIATAIMPPLCVVGYSLATSHWMMLGMAFYLFFLNFYFIYLSSVVVLNILEVPKVKTMTVKSWRREKFRMVRNTLIVLAPLIVLTILMGLHKLPGYTLSVASPSGN